MAAEPHPWPGAGAGLLVSYLIPENGKLGTWLHVAADGAVTVHTGKVEIGQDIRTSLAQVVAEELRVPLEAVTLVMGDTDRTPFDIGTFSSLTTRIVGAQLRHVAAHARELLAAMTPAQRRERHVATVTESDAITPPSRWTVAGRAAPKRGAEDCVTGARRYSTDLVLGDMLYGRILRPPAFGARLTALDTRAAEALPGVTVVRDGDLVGVTAPDSFTATQAIESIRATWARREQPSRGELFEWLRAHPVEVRGRGGAMSHEDGSLPEGWSEAEVVLARTYTTEYVAHVPMEPRAAVAAWSGDALTVWTATQRPFAVRTELAGALGVSEGRVRVIVPDAGCAFGGKHFGDAAVEAARLSRAAGRPVKLIWTRAEEFTWAYFRPAGVLDVTAGARADGTLTAWRLDGWNMGPEAIVPPYTVDHQRVAFQPARSPLRQGPYRALAATANVFARETHIDELGRVLGLDGLDIRRRNLGDPRLAAVLRASADAFGWRRERPGHGVGIACATEKGSYVGTCAEVVVEDGDVRVLRVVAAFECGTIVNPAHLRAQIVGALVQGLGGALFERVDFADGRILNASLADYRVPRLADVPRIEVVLLDRPDLPSAGAGETPIVGIAPAIGNAIFDATGVRCRSLPLSLHHQTDEETRPWRRERQLT
jgi:nicotinate dehydrogenase subunit B